MSEKPVCPRCGYMGPADARFCAHCGRSLVPLKVRLTNNIDRILNNLSPLHIGFLGLVLLVLISAYAQHLIVLGLSFPLSLIPLALVIGCGFAYLGWYWHASPPNRRYFVRMLLVFICMAGCLVAVWLVDMGLLSSVTDKANMVVYEIPGVYRQSTAEFRRMSIDANELTYGLIVMLYGILIAIAGYLIRRANERRSR